MATSCHLQHRPLPDMPRPHREALHLQGTPRTDMQAAPRGSATQEVRGDRRRMVWLADMKGMMSLRCGWSSDQMGFITPSGRGGTGIRYGLALRYEWAPDRDRPAADGQQLPRARHRTAASSGAAVLVDGPEILVLALAVQPPASGVSIATLRSGTRNAPAGSLHCRPASPGRYAPVGIVCIPRCVGYDDHQTPSTQENP